ncbi:MAG TPA: hypothetical protein VI411_10890 [Actinomycetota bacterium]
MTGKTISTTILGTAVLALLLAGSVAQASNPTVVTGTTKGDRIQGMNGAQIIFGRGAPTGSTAAKGRTLSTAAWGMTS